ncbi:hypothetical protein AKJ64_04810 [candidate division MSBL1 archaeon SCGC-AAA259E17]|uniref:Uncharacterized protein n=1 Tax=candidate division MSBL1 archaeon SCGC-AAA259E17 TaxID=1698263 RepID=A0A133UAY2_9EURY|nr:hypothetical protein AKJ64_04810 [candidate division MSBL1 archaeon SCGC-AAA259E17]
MQKRIRSSRGFNGKSSASFWNLGGSGSQGVELIFSLSHSISLTFTAQEKGRYFCSTTEKEKEGETEESFAPGLRHQGSIRG